MKLLLDMGIPFLTNQDFIAISPHNRGKRCRKRCASIAATSAIENSCDRQNWGLKVVVAGPALLFIHEIGQSHIINICVFKWPLVYTCVCEEKQKTRNKYMTNMKYLWARNPWKKWTTMYASDINVGGKRVVPSIKVVVVACGTEFHISRTLLRSEPSRKWI